KAVGAVLRADDPVKAARQTMSFVRRDPDAVAGVARAAWDHTMSRMFSQVEGKGLNTATARRYLTDNEGALRGLMGDARYDRAGRLVKASEINLRPVGAALPGSNTAQDLAVMAGAPNKATVASRLAQWVSTGAGAVLGGPGGAIAGHIAGEAAAHSLERNVN